MGRRRPLNRVLVIGQSGAGKTTTAAALARHLGVRHVELDALFHGPHWVPSATFVADVEAATAGERWVVDGNYEPVRDLLWSRADTLVWLDLPRTTTLRRAAVRTVRRLARRTPLWNGNRERWSTLLRASHPLRWTWQTHARHRAVYDARLADPIWGHLVVVRLRAAGEARAWLRDVTQ